MYQKQGFYAGQPLRASQLEAMEDGIIEAQSSGCGLYKHVLTTQLNVGPYCNVTFIVISSKSTAYTFNDLLNNQNLFLGIPAYCGDEENFEGHIGKSGITYKGSNFEWNEYVLCFSILNGDGTELGLCLDSRSTFTDEITEL